MPRLDLLSLGLALTLAAALPAASPGRYPGTWDNADSQTRGVTRLVVAGTGTDLKLQVFGKCHPTDCDWGVVDAVAHSSGVSVSPASDTEALTAVFDQGFKTAWVILKIRDANTLDATVYSRYQAGDSRPATVSTETFRRGAVVATRPTVEIARPLRRPAVRVPARAVGKEDCIPFQPKLARAQQVSGRWKVTVGSMLLLDFGAKANDARTAQRIIRHYGLDQQCFVGRPQPSLQYYLVNGDLPAGEIAGEDCVGFDPGNLEVKQVNGSWKIVEGDHWMFDFGADVAEARQAFAILRRYGATKSCFVGRPDAPMSYLRK